MKEIGIIIPLTGCALILGNSSCGRGEAPPSGGDNDPNLITSRVLADGQASAEIDDQPSLAGNKEDQFNMAIDVVLDKVEKGEEPTSADLAMLKSFISDYDDIFEQLRIINGFPTSLLPYFEDEIIQQSKLLLSQENVQGGSFYQPVELLGRLGTDESTAILVATLSSLPPFNFPETPPSPFHASFSHRGKKGEVAKAIIKSGNPAARVKYWNQLTDSLKAEGSANDARVLLFGLRSSTSLDDLKNLLQLPESKDPKVEQDISNAANSILNNMRSSFWEGDAPYDDRAYPNSVLSEWDDVRRKQRIDQQKDAAAKGEEVLKAAGIYDQGATSQY